MGRSRGGLTSKNYTLIEPNGPVRPAARPLQSAWLSDKRNGLRRRIATAHRRWYRAGQSKPERAILRESPDQVRRSCMRVPYHLGKGSFAACLFWGRSASRKFSQAAFAHTWRRQLGAL